MKHSTILLSSVLGGCLPLGLLLPRHGEAVMAPGRRRLTRSAFDGRMRRRRRGAASTASTSSSLRGGAAAVVAVDPPADTDDILPPLARIGLGAVVQTGLSYALAINLASFGTILRASALFVIVFGSSYFGSIVDMMGSSAATRQVLDPNRVPVSGAWGRFDFLIPRPPSSSSVLILLGHPLYLLSRAMRIGTRVSRSLDGTRRESPLFPLATSLGYLGRIPKTSRTHASYHGSPPPPTPPHPNRRNSK